MTVRCPVLKEQGIDHDCTTCFFKVIGRKGALKARETVPHSMRVEYGKRGGDGRGNKRNSAGVVREKGGAVVVRCGGAADDGGGGVTTPAPYKGERC